jgi:hypothetical protein
LYLQQCVEARRARTGSRWDAGVGAVGGQPGSGARVWRPLDVDQPIDVQPSERGQRDTDNEKDCRDGRSNEVWWRRSQDQPPPENPVRRV